MKKFVALGIATLMMVSNVFAGEISVKLNGNDVEFASQEPVIIEGRTLIPLRGVFEQLGYEIEWNGETKTASFVNGDTEVIVTVNANEFSVNGEGVSLDVPAQIVNGSMMLPLRAIGEATGLEVGWDSDSKTVSLDAGAVVTEETTEGTTEEATEKVTETVESESVPQEDLEAVQTAARSYITICSVDAMLSRFAESEQYNAYKFGGAMEYSYSNDEIEEILDSAIKECEKYKNVLATIKTGDKDKKLVKRFSELIDKCISDYKFTKEVITTDIYDDLTEEQFTAKSNSYSNAIKSATNSLFTEMESALSETFEILNSKKYNIPDAKKASSEDLKIRDAYYDKLSKIVEDNTKFLDDFDTKSNDSSKFEKAAQTIKEEITKLDTPNICLFDKEIAIMATDLLLQAGKDIKNGAYTEDGINESYIEFDYAMFAFDVVFEGILDDKYEMKYLDESSFSDVEENLEDIESKLV